MRKFLFQERVSKGQAAVEYLVALGALTVVALVAFRTILPQAILETNAHYTSAAANILGEIPRNDINGPFP